MINTDEIRARGEAALGKYLKPSAEGMITALRICAVDEPQNTYPCEGCYLYPYSRNGRMSTGQTCFEHLALDVIKAFADRDSEIEKLKRQTDSLMNGNIKLLDVIRRYRDAERKGQLVLLPVPIGASIFVPCRDKDVDGTPINEVDEMHLSGYIKEGEHEFYTTYDETGTCDVEAGDIFLTREEAEAALSAQETM